MIIELNKLTACYGTIYCYDDPQDPVRKSIEERLGEIIKVIILVDHCCISICKGK